jgi:putative flippase GtrA
MRVLVNRLLKFKSVRYIISGGLATAVDVFTYFVCQHVVFDKDTTYFGFISGPIASLMVSYSCGFVTNFSISKFFVFKDSDLRTRHQLMRYLLVALVVFALNYFCMKVLLELLNLYPTLSRIISVCTVATISYLLHNRFTFRLKKN